MIGKCVSHYKIINKIGQGGMAEVFEAIDLNTKETVALKVLLPQLSADEVVRKRFLREAKVGIELDHPGIAKVYEVGEEREQSFMAMEFVRGKTIEKAIQEETFDIDRVIDTGFQVADVLVAAHEKGIIHRDIKPRNIMLSGDRVKIMDFGLARIVEASSLTAEHAIVGTLFYMSPEQAIGAPIDERSDLFSLGAVLYQMFTGTLPFGGDHLGAIIHKILYSDPLRMKELDINIPIEVEQIVFKALQKKPQRRYQSARELKSDLEKSKEMLQGRTIELIATEEVFEESIRGIYSELVGREQEMTNLEGHLAHMLKGEGSTVFVSGEAGIGKSRLVWELGRKAKTQQARYIIGRCLFGEGGSPYQPILDVIRSYFELKGVKDNETLSDFIENKASHLARRMDVIRAALFMTGIQEVSLINKEQVWDTTTELVKVVAQDRPVVLHFDDVHWADLPTLYLLTYLSRNTREDKVLIIVTYRPEELVQTSEGRPHPLQTTLEMMGKDNLCEEIKLQRLDQQETHGVINSVFSDSNFPDDFTDSIYKETEGNPLFILEVLKLLRDEGIISRDDTRWKLSSDVGKIAIPSRMNDLIMRRMRRLTREERNIMDVAAVQGFSFQTDTLAYCLGFPRIRILRHLQDLESSHHLIHASEKEYHFDHGKIREVVYNSIISELREEYHKLIAEYLKENFGEKDEYAGKIAHHLLHAGLEQESLPYSFKAGLYAKRFFATEEALRYLEQALKIARLIGEEKTAGRILFYMGLIHENCGDYENALKYHEQSLRIRRQIGDKSGVGWVLRSIGLVHIRHGDYATALNYLKESLDIHNKIGIKRDMDNFGLIYRALGDYKKALSYHEQTLKNCKQNGDRIGEAGCLTLHGIVYRDCGDYETAYRFYKHALQIMKEVDDKRGQWYTLGYLGMLWWDVGNAKRALKAFEDAWRPIVTVGAKYRAWLNHDKGLMNFLNGSYSNASLHIQEGLKIAREIKDIDAISAGLLLSIKVELARSDNHQAMNYASEALTLATEKGRKLDVAEAHLLLARIHLSMEDLQKAEFHAIETKKIAKVCGMKEILWQAHHMLAKVHSKKKRLPFARKELRKAEQIADAISSNLSRELRQTYLEKQEIKELRNDLRNIKIKPGRGKKR